MANTYHKLYIQTVFAVKFREGVINFNWKHKFQAIIGNLINETGCKTLIVNGVDDHMHCFFGLKPSLSISEIMKSVKSKSSKYINDNHLTTRRFEWQEGFGAFSYNHNDLDRVIKYISNQEEHHKIIPFHQEYVELLNEFKIDFDEKYLFQPLI